MTQRKLLNVSESSPRQLGLTIPEMAVWSGDTVRMDEDGFCILLAAAMT